MKSTKGKPELRVDDLYATSRCLEAIIAMADDSFTKATFSLILEKINRIIKDVENGTVKTEMSLAKGGLQ